MQTLRYAGAWGKMKLCRLGNFCRLDLIARSAMYRIVLVRLRSCFLAIARRNTKAAGASPRLKCRPQ